MLNWLIDLCKKACWRNKNSFIISSLENNFLGYKFQTYESLLLFKRGNYCILNIGAGSVRCKMKRIVKDANFRHLNEFFFLFYFWNHQVLIISLIIQFLNIRSLLSSLSRISRRDELIEVYIFIRKDLIVCGNPD